MFKVRHSVVWQSPTLRTCYCETVSIAIYHSSCLCYLSHVTDLEEQNICYLIPKPPFQMWKGDCWMKTLSRKIRETWFLGRSKEDAYIFKHAQLIWSGNREMLVNSYKLPDIGWMSSGDLMYRMVIIIQLIILNYILEGC